MFLVSIMLLVGCTLITHHRGNKILRSNIFLGPSECWIKIVLPGKLLDVSIVIYSMIINGVSKNVGFPSHMLEYYYQVC